jgi:hypothetical protein
MQSLLRAATQRFQGDKPSVPRALAGATAAATATGVVVYRLLRQ